MDNGTEQRGAQPETKPRRRLNKNVISVLIVAAGLIGILVLISVVFPSQDATRRRLEAERAAKEEELRQLQLERESLQELAALIGNQEYLIRYLREHQGYMFEGDIRFDLTDPNAPVPTRAPQAEATPLPTLIPTPDPFATDAPETEAPVTEAP